jgi:polysaccharide biosynthesis protein PslG
MKTGSRPLSGIYARLTGVAVLLGVLLIAATSPSTAAAAEPGVVSDLNWGINETEKQQTVAAMTDAKVRWTRLSLNWHDLEPSQGSYSSWWLADLDRSVQLAHDAGVKLILNLTDGPQWASGSTNRRAPPRDPEDVVPFLRFIADRYQGKVQAYEIWNEENLTYWWSPGPDPAGYTALLKAAYPAVKSADPSATVVFGGLNRNDYQFVEAAYAAGAKGYFDVMAVHPFTCKSPTNYYWVDGNTETWIGEGSDPPPSGSNARISKYPYLGYREVRRSMLAQGDDKPIWFTEFGWSTASPTTSSCVVDEATQAQYLTQAFQIAEQDPYVQVALTYNLREFANPSTVWDNGFGLMRWGFTPKPAYYAFRDYASGAQPAPDPSPGPAPSPSPSPSPPPNQAPSITLLKPVEGQTFTNQLYMAAQASDDHGVSRVDFLIDGKRVATDYSASYDVTWKVKKLSHAKHTVTTRAYDTTGLTASDSTWVKRVR